MIKKISIFVIVIILLGSGFWFFRSRSSTPIVPQIQTNPEINPAVQNLKQQIIEAAKKDYDLDGLSDAEEAKLGTDSKVADTDGDGITDATEVYLFKSNPLKKDSFNLGMTDGEAVTKGLIKPDKSFKNK